MPNRRTSGWLPHGAGSAGPRRRGFARAQAIGQRQPTLAGAISAALPWLPWTQRSELFSHLVALKLDDNQLRRVAAEMGILKTTAGTAAIWNLATRADGKPPSAGTDEHAVLDFFLAL